MSIFVDRKYVNLISSRVQRFAPKGNDAWNMRCPYCGDSQKSKTKARGYIYRHKQEFFYKCWNCSISTTLGRFLKDLDARIHEEWKLERFIESNKGVDTNKELSENARLEAMEGLEKLKFAAQRKIDLDGVCEHISDLDDKHIARMYLRDRQIPMAAYKYLVFTNEFRKLAQRIDPERASTLHESEARVVILLLDVDERIVGISGRSLTSDAKGIKYITLKKSLDTPKIFGLDRVPNIKGDVWVFEGQFDAMFFENAIATGDSELTNASKYITKERLVLVYDNQPRNNALVKQMKKAVDDGFRICIWPSSIEQKDVNEMIISGISDADIYHTINTNIFSGMKAKMRLQKWAMTDSTSKWKSRS
jgi:hypothetical protein